LLHFYQHVYQNLTYKTRRDAIFLPSAHNKPPFSTHSSHPLTKPSHHTATMFAPLATSPLRLDLGPMPPSPTHPLTLSSIGSFAVESYTPSRGCAGDILTVTLAF